MNRQFMVSDLDSLGYHPFGMVMPSRNWAAGGADGYRFGFNGKECDSETHGDDGIYDYGFRIYNPRLGKFLSVDPLHKSYPWYSPYQFSGNKPINSIDLDGQEELLAIRFFDSDGKYVGMTYLRVADVSQRDEGRQSGGDMQIIELNQNLQSTINNLPSGSDISAIIPQLKKDGKFIGRYIEVMPPQYSKVNGEILAANNTLEEGELPNAPKLARFVVTKVHFIYDATDEVPELKGSELAAIKNALANDPDRRLEIVGYSSEEGESEDNQKLSERRAESVRDYLISNGVDESRIVSAKGAGETTKEGSGPENYEKNRIAEISFTYEME